MPWEHFSHQADMGIRGQGASKEEAFEQAALALTAVITDLDKVEPLTSVTVQREDTDDEFGATYTSLQVRQEPGGEWVAQYVVDV
jgi:SHS2 domain-containing protein